VLLTVALFCGPMLICFSFLNTVAIAYHSTAALPFGTICVIFVIWALITFPLTVLGGIAGKNKQVCHMAGSVVCWSYRLCSQQMVHQLCIGCTGFVTMCTDCSRSFLAHLTDKGLVRLCMCTMAAHPIHNVHKAERCANTGFASKWYQTIITQPTPLALSDLHQSRNGYQCTKSTCLGF
jgi:hypothetical protein